MMKLMMKKIERLLHRESQVTIEAFSTCTDPHMQYEL